jgi:nitrate/nitrite transporter NarK
MEQELIQVNTNSADDSKGVAFGLSGNLFLFVIGGAIISGLLMTIFIAFMKMEIMIAGILSAIPLALATAYAIFFLQGKPPHYKDDLFLSIVGMDFVSPAPDANQRRNPLTDGEEH